MTPEDPASPADTADTSPGGDVPYADASELEQLRRAVAEWRRSDVAAAERGQPLRKPRFVTWSDIDVPDLFTPADVPVDYARDLGLPGEYPFTRGVQPTMYRGRLWTMRMFAGFGTPEQTNERFKLPARAGPDRALHRLRFPDPHGLRLRLAALARRGRHVRRRRRHAARHGGPLRRHPARPGHDVDDHQRPGDRAPRASTSRSPTSAASRASTIGGTVQNDCLKEFIAQHAWLVPPRPAMRIVTDMIEFCSREVPRWNTVSISGYHIREAGATAAQELAFTIADGIALRRELPSSAASTSTTSRRGSASSSTCTTTSSRRSRSSAPRGASGRAS